MHSRLATEGAAQGGARGAGAWERRLQRGHAPGPQLPSTPAENARVLRRSQALLTPVQAMGPGRDGEMPSAFFEDLLLRLSARRSERSGQEEETVKFSFVNQGSLPSSPLSVGEILKGTESSWIVNYCLMFLLLG